LESRAAISTNAGQRAGIAERLWNASRTEFSLRGYHGARVQGIARRAGCNVALLYRHWSSKKALYLDVPRTGWPSMSGEVVSIMEERGGAPSVVGAYLDANLRDPVGAQIMIREFLDGGPFLSQLTQDEPALMEPMKRAAEVLAASLGDAGPVASAHRVEVTRRRGRLQVHVADAATLTKQQRSRAAVRITGALRELDPFATGIDVGFDGADA